MHLGIISPSFYKDPTRYFKLDTVSPKVQSQEKTKVTPHELKNEGFLGIKRNLNITREQNKINILST